MSMDLIMSWALVLFRTGPGQSLKAKPDGIKACMHSTMSMTIVCVTVCFILSGIGPVRNETAVLLAPYTDTY